LGIKHISELLTRCNNYVRYVVKCIRLKLANFNDSAVSCPSNCESRDRAENTKPIGLTDGLTAGNRATAKTVFRQPGFNFSVIVDLLHNDDFAVQTVAGAALAAFSYNIASNQRMIARSAGQRLTFAHFKHMLTNGDELQRSNAAFQA